MTTREADLSLWDRMNSDDEDEAYAAYEILVIHYQYLVEATARKLERRLPSYLEDDELISLGQIGLLRAISKYESDRGPFSRFASAIVYGAIIDGLRSSDFAPRGLRKQQRDLDQATRELRDEGVINPTVEDIATKVDMEPEEVREIQHKVVRAEVAPSDPSLLPSVRTSSASQDLWSRELCREFVVWLKEFDKITQEVVALKYWKGLSMKAISEAMGLPVEVVRAKHRVVLSKILPFMEDIARDS